MAVAASWGHWEQTTDEVLLQVSLPNLALRAKDVHVQITSSHLDVSLKTNANPLLNGALFATIVADDSTWTLEKGQLNITLVKALKGANQVWKSLMADGRFAPNAKGLDEMQKKLTLERFQQENPALDFSSAEITGNYQNGGPQLL